MTPERPEKRTRAEALILQAETFRDRSALDFGMQFARNRRQQIDNICRELRESLQASNEPGIDTDMRALQDALSELNHEVRSYYSES